MNTLQCTAARRSQPGREAGNFQAKAPGGGPHRETASGRPRGVAAAGRALIPAFTAALLSCCSPGTESAGPPFSADLVPPTLISAETTDERTVSFLFDETATADPGSVVVDPPLPVASVDSGDDRVSVIFAEDQGIGTRYTIRLDVEDGAGNSLSFLYIFSGWNPRVPEILITEINPRGSGNTPDCIEMLVTAGGNLGGLRLTVGTENEYSEELVFPTVEVQDGDYILAHAKSEGLAGECDEVDAIDVSGGLLASDEARDFWIPGSPGLPGNNGAVTLYARHGGPVVDAVLWSEREYDPSDGKLGWTSDGYTFAADLSAAEAWDAAGGGTPTPSDAVDVSVSTATRSLCRTSVPADSDSAADWHTVPTRGATFGGVNSDEVYVP